MECRGRACGLLSGLNTSRLEAVAVEDDYIARAISSEQSRVAQLKSLNFVPRERLFKVILRRAVASALSIWLQPSSLRNNQTEGTLGSCSLRTTL